MDTLAVLNAATVSAANIEKIGTFYLYEKLKI